METIAKDGYRMQTLITEIVTKLPFTLRHIQEQLAAGIPRNYRVLFELEGACLVVYDVGDRKDIYE